jgi:hypothetical protein
MKYNSITEEYLLNILKQKIEYISNYDIICLMKETKKDLDLNKYPLPPKPPLPRIIKYDSKFEIFIANCIPYILLLIFISAFIFKCA